MIDRTGNMPPLPGIFPDYAAPIVRNQPGGPLADDALMIVARGEKADEGGMAA
jgi:hypothetical protein